MKNSAGAGISIFHIPRPFTGHFGIIQRNAITSWCLLKPKPEIILFGTEEGTKEICAEFGLRHYPHLDRSDSGRPMLDDLFRQAQSLAQHDLVACVNSDIILMQDFMDAVARAQAESKPWILIIRRWNANITEPIDFSRADWAQNLRRFVMEKGQAPFSGADVVLFRKGFYQNVLPFPLGTGHSDDWLIWNARKRKAIVWDGTYVAMIIHQNHHHAFTQGQLPRALLHEVHQSYVLNGGWSSIFHHSLPTRRFTKNGFTRVPFTEYLTHLRSRIISTFAIKTFRVRSILKGWWKSLRQNSTA